jgi:hypothetical protein
MRTKIGLSPAPLGLLAVCEAKADEVSLFPKRKVGNTLPNGSTKAIP